MKIAELMTVEVVTTSPDALLKHAARELAARGVSGLPVLDPSGGVVGVLSEADVLAKEAAPRRSANPLLRFLEGPPLDDRFDALTVGDAMSAPAVVIGPDRHVSEAAAAMLAEGINRLPVVDADGRLVGIVTRADLVRAFARDDATIRSQIIAAMRSDLWIDPSVLQVEVHDGVVSLDGALENEAEADALTAYIRRVPGVVEVRETLRTRH